jgi:hypothetical protein
MTKVTLRDVNLDAVFDCGYVDGETEASPKGPLCAKAAVLLCFPEAADPPARCMIGGCGRSSWLKKAVRLGTRFTQQQRSLVGTPEHPKSLSCVLSDLNTSPNTSSAQGFYFSPFLL